MDEQLHGVLPPLTQGACCFPTMGAERSDDLAINLIWLYHQPETEPMTNEEPLPRVS